MKDNEIESQLMDKAVTTSEEERIRLWKEERAKVAEAEKAERVRKKKEERELEAKVAEEKLQDEAKNLLPSREEYNSERDKYLSYLSQKRKNAAKYFSGFVIAPTLLFGLLLNFIVVPLYSAHSVIVVKSQDGNGGAPVIGLMAAGSNSDSQTDAFMAYEYIRSQALMEALEESDSFVSNYSSDLIDPIFRFRNVGLFGSSKADQLERFIRVSINIQTGLLSLEVKAPTPMQAVELSTAVIDMTAKRVNELSEELFNERVKSEEVAVNEARLFLNESQKKLTQLQIVSGEQDPLVHIQSIYQNISQLETQALELKTKIRRAQISGVNDRITTKLLIEHEAELKERIKVYRAELISGDDSEVMPLNSLLIEFDLAKLEVKIASETLSTTLQSLAQVRRDASLAKSQFQVVVQPSTSDLAKHPKVFRGMFLLFIILLASFLFGRAVFKPKY
jgi:capsule polysaccharide export protein KpsE/RkpR